jgi:ADP-heptose:LPS heptosyltransferase
MQIANRFHKPSEIRRILIIQLGDIGDVVWSLPAFQAVREAYPGATIAVLLREGNGALLAADISPPEIFEVRKGPGRVFGDFSAPLRLVRALRRKRFDLVFDLRGDERGGYMAFLTGAPVRAAQYYQGLSWLRNRLFTHLATLSSSGGHPKEGAAASSLDILKAFGIEAVTVVPQLRLSDDVRLHTEKLLVGEGILPTTETTRGGMSAYSPAGASPYGWVTVNPFSRWAYKEWSPEKWVRIIDWFRQEFGIAAVIVGSPAERRRAGELAGGCLGRVYNLAGRTTLAELAGVLERSRLHVGVDSAAPHIAAAVGTPTVTLYGPSDWRYWAPPGDRHRVAVSDMDCVPCHQKGCEGGGVSRCLNNLKVERVQAVLREVLSG